MEPVVHLRAAVAVLGRFPALTGVDLDVHPGEILHLQGPNGAGKTTLLRVCAGLVPVVEGTATVLGHDLRRDRRSVRRSVGVVGHETFLYDDLTVADNVRFWARAARAEDADAVAAMRRMGVDGPLARLPVASLSMGQRRRTSFAAMLARRPALWLLDEPHAGLDRDGRDVVDDLIRGAAAAGATVVLASHELERAGSIGGRAVTIEGGRVAGRSEVGPDCEGPGTPDRPEAAGVA